MKHEPNESLIVILISKIGFKAKKIEKEQIRTSPIHKRGKKKIDGRANIHASNTASSVQSNSYLNCRKKYINKNVWFW